MCDLYFRSIENKSKKRTCLTVDDWGKVMTKAGCAAKNLPQANLWKWDWLDRFFYQKRMTVDKETEISDIRGFYKYSFVMGLDETEKDYW